MLNAHCSPSSSSRGVHGLSLPEHLRQGRLRLWQPEGHVHGAVQMHSHVQVRMRKLHPSSLAIQGAEAPVAMGLKRAHAERLGQGEGLAVVGCSGLDLWGIVTRMALAEEP